MRSILITLMFTITACASNPILVSARFKPKKQGVVQVPIANTPRHEKFVKEDAAKIMKKFCGDQRAEITEINRHSTPTGSSSAVIGGALFTETDFDEASYVHFDCIDSMGADL